MKTHLGHFEIVEELGRGGMGVVYKGYDPALNRYVAIKELSPSLAHDASLVERFLREARSMAALNDPYIIQVYFIGTDESTGQPFFAMEFIEGESLSGLLKRDGQLSVENALKLMNQTAQGLATAHDKGVVHRDIKPANLMITPKGQVKIADFGIALASTDFSKKLTATGEFVGTPGYLSPEVCLGKQVDQRSDIFALGIVLFEMLSGRIPFTDESPLGLMLEVVKAEIPDIRTINNAVDPQCAAILSKMLAKEPGDRFQNCHELAAALQAHPLVAKGGTVQLSRPKPELAAATMVGGATPASGQQRIATPPPVVRSSGSQAVPPPTAPSLQNNAAPPQPPAQPAAAAYAPARASALDRPKRSGTGIGLALAAGVVLLLGLGFVFRGAFGEFLLRSEDPATAATMLVDQGNQPATATTASSPTTANSGTSASSTPMGLAGSAPPVASTAPTAAVAAVDPSLSTPPALAVEAGGDASAVRESAPVTASEQNLSAALQANTAPDASQRPRERIAEAVAERREAARDVAAATAPRKVAEPPPPPRIAVIGIGDPALTDAAKQQIEERLFEEGLEVLDTAIAGVDGRSDLPGLFAALRREATILVVVRADPLGSQQLNYYGQSSTLYSANLSVRVYDIAGRRPLGPGFRERIDFTNLNVNENTGIALQPHLGGLMREAAAARRRAAG